jgi:alpha-glucosidase
LTALLRKLRSLSFSGVSRRLIVQCAFTSLLLAVPAFAQNPSVSSPDGRLRLQFDILPTGPSGSQAGQLVDSLFFNGRPLLQNSSLSLSLTGGPPLGQSVSIVSAVPASGIDDYREVAGKTSHVHDAFNSLALTVKEPGPSGRTMTIQARAYDGAVAFRYLVPRQPGMYRYALYQEHTGFDFAKDARIWAIQLPNFRSAYEGEYLHLHISSLGIRAGEPSTMLVGLPLLSQVPGVGWVAISEADLEDNGAMCLTNDRQPGLPGQGQFRLTTALSPRFTDLPSYPILAVAAALPHHTAWRILQVAAQPADLINSNIVHDLNPPSRIPDTSWIHPGKAAWDWWNGNTGPDGKSANTTAMAKFFVDFAARSGFRYMLVDAGWSKPGDITQLNGSIDVPSLVRYAASKGIGIWVWASFADARRQMEQAFPLYRKWGIAGVKIDYIQRSDQPGIAFYYRAASLAAKYHLMLDFHGTTTPWGISRTWPNVMAYEAVMGLEYNKWSARDDPPHRATLPFTRMLNGPMDYTPGGFDNATEANFIPRDDRPMVQGTRAQQLALYVIDFSPIQMVSDAPQAYAAQPSFQFIRDVPAAWDQTLALQGFPSKTVTIARRAGRDWFVGSITNWTPRTVTLPLNFLGAGQYTAQIYADAQDAAQHPTHVSIETKTVTNTGTLTLHLAPGGGAAIRLVPKA